MIQFAEALSIGELKPSPLFVSKGSSFFFKTSTEFVNEVKILLLCTLTYITLIPSLHFKIRRNKQGRDLNGNWIKLISSLMLGEF